MKKIYDISVPISAKIPTYPGDPGLSLEERMHISQGDIVNLLHISMGVHTATHMDSPHHILNNGITMDDVPLDRCIGPARVLAFPDPVRRIDRPALSDMDLGGVTRVLLKTSNSARWNSPQFDKRFVALAPDGAQYLVDHGIEFVGIDYLSVDPFGSQDLPAHHILLNRRVVILEGINLSDIEPGDYELICLPLSIKGSDGAPARVVLRTLDS